MKVQKSVLALALLALTGFWDLRTEASGTWKKKGSKPPAPTPTPTPPAPAPCCTEAAPICACNECVTQQELALVSCVVPEDDPDSINNCCDELTPLPFPIAECCTADAPICSCVGCVSPDELAAITCPANPPEPFNCCANPGGEGGLPGGGGGLPGGGGGLPRPPPTVPPGPFDGTDCCDESSLCCCGACRAPEVCAVITCLALPDDLPDDYRPCCGDPIDGGDPEADPEEDPEEDPKEDPKEDPEGGELPGPPPTVPPVPFDGEDCCDESSLCCCGACRTPEVCAATTCAALPDDLPDDYRPCCGDPIDGGEPDPKPAPPPKPPVKPAECCTEDKPKCACGTCVFDPDNQLACKPAPGWDGDCCPDEPEPAPPPTPPPEIAECCTAEAPACCCGGCATPDFCAVVDCLPDAPAGCCGDEGPSPSSPPPPPIKEPPVPPTCCKEGQQCCCGACSSPDLCARIRCAFDPDDDGTCCPPEVDEPEGEEPVKPWRGFKRTDCCEGFETCCCGKCRSALECVRIDCAIVPTTSLPETCCDSKA